MLGQRAGRVVLHLAEGRVPGPAALADRAAARRATVDYIAWYNGARLHSALGYQTPDQYESITPRRSLLRQPDRAIGPVRQTGATPASSQAVSIRE